MYNDGVYCGDIKDHVIWKDYCAWKDHVIGWTVSTKKSYHRVRIWRIKYYRPTIGDNGCAFSIFFIQKLKFLLSVIRKIFQSSTLGDDLDCGLSKEFYALIKVYMRRRDL